MRLVLWLSFVSLLGCRAPEVVRRAEVQQAVIFDSVSDGFREYVATLPADTPERVAAKEALLKVINLRRGEYRSLHEQLRQYLDTDELVKALEAAEPTAKAYLEWLMEKL
jgi:hypothetical protein